ncbi:hypothetical protein L1887_40660 [Cichorium endivia]|nr:hypothetical protein L1887_40660 [Cichorium endivia]
MGFLLAWGGICTGVSSAWITRWAQHGFAQGIDLAAGAARRQKAGGGDALVDHLGRHGGLDQCFALATGPFPTHMLFDGENARRVIQLFADVFTDALQLAAAGALGVLRFVADHGARKLCRQRCALGLLAGFGLEQPGD